MREMLLVFFFYYLLGSLCAQNLLVNPDAESLPRGTGWTIVNQGALTCEFAPTTNFLNWTMKPNGTVNYPFDHTTGVNGGTVFFSGCDSYFAGPFELYQVVDVSADAANIDFGGQLYTFGGYMQTPVSPQTDEGRFIVDYLSATNTILAGSYTTAWQSFSGGSGTSWKYYEDTRTAPIGTRKIKVRLQAKLYLNQTAVNVYFDDISLAKPTIVPINLLSFTGKYLNGTALLNWRFAAEPVCATLELQRASNLLHWQTIETFSCNSSMFYYEDLNGSPVSYNYYRLKITAVDGKISFSEVITLHRPEVDSISLFPNPAVSEFTITGLQQYSNITILNSGGQLVKSIYSNGPVSSINVSSLAPGVYVVRINNSKTTMTQKLIIKK